MGNYLEKYVYRVGTVYLCDAQSNGGIWTLYFDSKYVSSRMLPFDFLKNLEHYLLEVTKLPKEYIYKHKWGEDSIRINFVE